jgi:hypothetical protein
MINLIVPLVLLLLPVWTGAQPSPEIYERIEAAIKATANQSASEIDYTQFVNPFIGTCECVCTDFFVAG